MTAMAMGEEYHGAPLLRAFFYVGVAQVRQVDSFEVSLIDREETASRHYLNGGGRAATRDAHCPSAERSHGRRVGCYVIAPALQRVIYRASWGEEWCGARRTSAPRDLAFMSRSRP